MKDRLGYFRFKRLAQDYLLTNDSGDYMYLMPAAFDNLCKNRLNRIACAEYDLLKERGFVSSGAGSERLIEKYRTKNNFLGTGTSLHIIVATLRCDHRCVYCQTSAQNSKCSSTDMSLQTAKNVVDRIFESPNNAITIEFQGGEPLLNFKALKYIIEYAQEKNKSAGKDLIFSLVTNLSPLNDDMLKFLLKSRVSICTSVDGPRHVHNINRLSLSSVDGYAKVTKAFKKVQRAYRGRVRSKPNALVTITRHSLGYSKQIVDEYVSLGLNSVHLRPLNPFGLAAKQWGKIGYTPKEFLDFYKKSLDYILALNLKGKVFYERTVRVFLAKIFNEMDPGFLELRSPCGAAIGQLAYNYNGDVYTCDEGRMFGALGDTAFKIGNVKENNYKDFINAEATKAVCIASFLDILPGCSSCVYKPYCGVCPIYNYATGGSLFAQAPNNDRCKINMGILDYLFDRLRDKKNKKIFKSWLLVNRGPMTV